ncbi:TetR family transcriptional regulator [Nocardioides plantarum]|uniref:TetR family transcriptional regulator n=1 Tax=Nocardioides plantarum TaxID=29299 RepID=A0ABV5KHK6_9ACTN|nr:TetR/AcrR family transcriptional regulator C-terminal domain-containing protein [Nocardioides plantarum]
MATKTRAATAAKERLSRDTVARAALGLVDAEGLDALTVRRLATGLGVTPMALYWHFKDKDALLDGVAEQLLAEVALPAPDDTVTWDVQLRAALEALLAGLAAHPAVAQLVGRRILLNDPGREIAERILRLLRDGGCSPEQASQLGMYALMFMTSLVADEPGLAVGTTNDERDQEVRAKWAALQALPPKRFPTIIESAETLTDCAASEQWLGFGLDTLLAGIRGVAPGA